MEKVTEAGLALSRTFISSPPRLEQHLRDQCRINLGVSVFEGVLQNSLFYMSQEYYITEFTAAFGWQHRACVGLGHLNLFMYSS